MSGFRCQFCKGSLTKVHYPKLYNMAHLLSLNVLLLPKNLTIIFYLMLYLESMKASSYMFIFKQLVASQVGSDCTSKPGLVYNKNQLYFTLHQSLTHSILFKRAYACILIYLHVCKHSTIVVASI